MNLANAHRHWIFRYGFAVVSVALFTALKLYMDSQLGLSRPFFLMRLPVLLAAYWMGLGPSLLALFISALAVDYFFLPPDRSLKLNPASLYSEVLFVLEALLMIGIIMLLRRALDDASRRTGQLTLTEERLKVALAGTSISVSSCDRDLRFEWVYNPPPEFRVDDILHKRPQEILPGPQIADLETAMAQVLESGAGSRVELTVPLQTGLHTYDVVIEPQRDKGGTINGVMLASTDVTERKRHEEVLREEEAKFRQLADSMPEMVWAAQPDGYIDYWNNRWYKFTGFPEGEEGDDSWVPVVHPDDVQPALNEWYRCVKTGEPLQAEFRLRDLHAGEFRWFLNRAVPVRDNKGIITRWYGSLTDMHDYRAAIDALRKSEERFRSLVTATSQIVWTTDAEGLVEDIPQWRELTGQGMEEVRGFGWLEAVHPDDRESTLQSWQSALEQGENCSVEYRIRLKENLYRWFAVRGVPVRDADGTIREWVGVCIDIEQQKRAEEQMRHAAEAMVVARDAAVQANRAKSAFLANISHELRTPLNAILGYAEILQEDLRPLNQPQMFSDVDRIFTAGNHLLSVVNDILDLSKIEAGRMNLDLRTFTIESVLDDVRATMQPLAERNGNRLVFDACQDCTLHTDPNKLRQVLTNLVSNACKFTENGVVTLRCWRTREWEREWIYISVIDTGIGIAHEDLPRLFHDFTQLDASLTRRYGGTGLGLAISERFATLMGGSILVESEEGKGSTFTLKLPATFTVGPAKEPGNVAAVS